MNNAREILVRTGMVLAFTQIPGVSYVEFQENGNPMTDSDGRELGPMERSSFVENEGKNINSYVFADLNLYFSNENGDHLVRENRRIHYSSNVPLERVIVEKLLEGPKSDDMLPTLSSNTKILGVSIVEGICYVNLDKSFSDRDHERPAGTAYLFYRKFADGCLQDPRSADFCGGRYESNLQREYETGQGLSGRLQLSGDGR